MIPKNSSLITTLFKPTAEYLGTELRDFVKSRVEDLKQSKRGRNTSIHISGVQKKLASIQPTLGADQDEPSLEQLEFLDCWIENVQDVDPVNVELSEMWQNLLARAVLGEQAQQEVLNALKSLSPREAKYLSDFSLSQNFVPITGFTPKVEHHFAKSLEAKGILERDYLLGISFIVSAVISGIVLFGFMPNTYSQAQLGTAVITSVVAISMSVIVLQSALRRWRITWLGKELLRLVRNDMPQNEIAE